MGMTVRPAGGPGASQCGDGVRHRVGPAGGSEGFSYGGRRPAVSRSQATLDNEPLSAKSSPDVCAFLCLTQLSVCREHH